MFDDRVFARDARCKHRMTGISAEEDTGMKLVTVMAVLLVTFAMSASVSRADSSALYPFPDGASVAIHLDTGLAFVFADIDRTHDLNFLETDRFGNFSVALWLNFLGVNVLGQSVYNVFGSLDGLNWVFLQTTAF